MVSSYRVDRHKKEIDEYPNTGYLGFWLMQYFNQERNRVYQQSKNGTPSKKEVIQVTKISIKVNREVHRTQVVQRLSWFDDFLQSGDTISFTLENPNGSSIPVTILLTDDRVINFHQIDLQVASPENFKAIEDIGPIHFSLRGDILTLKFENYWNI